MVVLSTAYVTGNPNPAAALDTTNTQVNQNTTDLAKASAVLAYDPASLDYIVPQHTSTATAAAFTLNKMVLQPITIPVVKAFDRITTNLTVVGTGAGQVIRLGLYADDGSGRKPAGGAVDAGTLDSTVGTGDRALTIGWTPGSAGRYWLAWVLQIAVTTSPTVVTLNSLNQLGLTTLGNGSLRSWAQTGVTGALPTIGTLVRDADSPMIGIRAA